jgi:RNA polymerase sigma factor (sigma-70 family)
VRDPDPQLVQIEAAYRSNYGHFLHVATAITGEAELAADAVQDAFARAIARRDTYRGTGSLEGWLWRILVNAARDVVARRRDAVESEPRAAAVTTASSSREVEGVRAAVARLPERQRLVLFLRYFADLDYLAIGQALDISPGTVGATLHSAHDALRRRIEEVQIG